TPAQRREPALHGWGGCGCRAEAHAAREPASHDRDVRPPRARLPAAGDLQAVLLGGSARRASTARRRRQRAPHGTATARGPRRRSARRMRRDFRTPLRGPPHRLPPDSNLLPPASEARALSRLASEPPPPYPVLL